MERMNDRNEPSVVVLVRVGEILRMSVKCLCWFGGFGHMCVHVSLLMIFSMVRSCTPNWRASAALNRFSRICFSKLSRCRLADRIATTSRDHQLRFAGGLGRARKICPALLPFVPVDAVLGAAPPWLCSLRFQGVHQCLLGVAAIKIPA